MHSGVYLFFLGAFVSEIAGSLAGFGSSTLFLPIALQFYDFRTALILVALLHIFGNISRVAFFRHGVDKKIFLKFGVPSIFFSLIGALLVPYIPQNILKLTLGIFLIIYSLYVFWHDNFRVKPTGMNDFLGGALSGFFAGLIGTGGPLRGAFLTAFHLPKEKYIATAALVALAVDAIRIPVYFANGFLDPQLYWMIPIMLVVALAGSFFGNEIVKLFPLRVFRRIILLALFIIGIQFTLENVNILF